MKTKARYPNTIIFLHWLIALLILANLLVGWLLDDYAEVMQLHKSLGVMILFLVLLRIAMRLFLRSKIPDSVNPENSLALRAEKLAHSLLYGLMFLLPLTGYLKSNAAGRAINVFGWIDLPALLEKNQRLSAALGEIHSAIATMLVLLVALHIGAALFHVLRNKESVITRMTPARFSKYLGN